MSDLLKGFQENFEVVYADKQELIEHSLALRYQVYCVERSFETSSSFDDGKETDVYDARSVHGLVFHRGLGSYVGSVRLVLVDDQAPDAAFPIETLCDSLLKERRALLDECATFRVAEISRFAVSKARKHCGDGSPAAGRHGNYPVPVERSLKNTSNILPHATLGLFAAIVQMSARNNITHWYALMEPTLLRLLSRFGIYFQSVGPMVHFRGWRQPVLGHIDAVLAGIYLERPDVWELITDFGRVWPLCTPLPGERVVGGTSVGAGI